MSEGRQLTVRPDGTPYDVQRAAMLCTSPMKCTANLPPFPANNPDEGKPMTKRNRDQTSAWLWVGVVLVGFFVATVAVVGCLWVMAMTRTDSTVGENKVYSRDEFDQLVKGKTPDEVIAAVGRPTHTFSDDRWGYYHRVMNPITAKPDTATVEFKDGRVYNVDY